MYKHCPQRGEKIKTTHSVQQVVIVEHMGKNVPRIYILDNKQVEF
jgi:hypothetical protein